MKQSSNPKSPAALIADIQRALVSEGIDAWLFTDHHRRDPLAYRILGLSETAQQSRRWFYLISAKSEPIKVVHRIENAVLDCLPGAKLLYASWTDLKAQLTAALSKSGRVAMQYSPSCNIPYVSMVDGGTIEFIRSLGVDVASSADLIQEFEARWTAEQYQSHLSAGKLVDLIRREAFDLIRGQLNENRVVTELDIQQFIVRSFKQSSLITDHGPIVAVNANASDPHYEPSRDHHAVIKRGDLVLIDLWAKFNNADAVYYDVTWTAFCGRVAPSEMDNIFEIVKQSRLAACDFVNGAVEAQVTIQGWQVDDAARDVISGHGFAEQFFHRTGHNIGKDVHGTGANMDNFEAHDERKIIRNTCFSIEPGIYLPQFGIRSEVNVFVEASRAVVTGEQQESLVLL